MNEASQILGALGQALLIVGGTLLVMMTVFIVGTMLWVRRKVQNKVVAIFIEPNRQTTEELIPIDETGKIKSKNTETQYLLVPKKSFWSKWPKGFPIWMQESVPTLIYERGNAEPYDPGDQKTVLSARTLRYITDPEMLKATWKDAAESIGIAPSNLKSPIVLVGVILGGLILILGIFMFVIFQKVTELDTFVRSLA